MAQDSSLVGGRQDVQKGVFLGLKYPVTQSET